MAIVPRDPHDWIRSFRKQMDDLFTRLFNLEPKGFVGESDYLPPVDCFETGNEFVVEIELPGFEREDLSLRVCYNMLVLEGIKRPEKRERAVNFICLERIFGRFSRVVEIPPLVDINGVKAGYSQGVLTATFPKIADNGMLIKDIPIE